MNKNGFFQLTQKVFLRNNDFLLILKDRKSQTGDLPGGRLTEEEFFGEWRNGLYREIFEELGGSVNLDIHPDPIFVKKHRVDDGNYPCIILGYDAKYIGGEIFLSDEHEFFQWVDLNVFNPKSFFSGFMLDAVEFYIQKYK